MSLALLLTLTLTNLISVRAFGEFEFWFASIKVGAIVVFLLLGSTYVLGLVAGNRRAISPISPPTAASHPTACCRS